MSGLLIGVGVGPGDPELLTLKALRAFQEADRVFVPVTDTGETGRAENVIRAHVDPQRVERLMFAMSDAAAREGNWDRAGDAIAAVVGPGGTAAFATIGDPNIYSTFTYVAQTVGALVPELRVQTIPGITAMQDLAARSGTVLAEGTERLALFPFTAGEERLREALAVFDTVVCYKGGRRLPAVVTAVRDAGRLDDAVYGARLGLDDEEVRPASDLGPDETGPYMSTVIVPARRDGERGGRI
jgi:precorrin-2/cobalt-factor-2 C20-methyltransferase